MNDKPVGIWVGASHALRRPVAVAGVEYPHICGVSFTATVTPGLRIRATRRDCAACAEQNAPPAARRLGETPEERTDEKEITP